MELNVFIIRYLVNRDSKYRIMFIELLSSLIFLILFTRAASGIEDPLRTMKYTSRSVKDAEIWQNDVRLKLYELLQMNDLVINRKNIPLDPAVILTEDKGDYLLKEIEFNSTKNRRIRAIITIPKEKNRPLPAVVCIHGHKGSIRSVYEKASIYKGFAAELAVRNCITIAVIVSQHEVLEKDRILMGERLWDLMRCVDYLESLNEVNKNKIGCAGLSLGGEMAMWLGAMDERIRATVSSGFLTRMDQMEQNHCMCWKFAGLREIVDYADIYSLIAPRSLQCQNGLNEPSKGFTVQLASDALKEIKVIYTDFRRPENVSLITHAGAHEIDLPSLLTFFHKQLGTNKL
ncbi:MAG: hypothetical protein QG611_393 [Bacteroidota bacterium]|nr:hypothetical protein [Bacteroidota bacterium]